MAVVQHSQHPSTTPASVVNLHSPVLWLTLGWRDLRQNPLPGLLHGMVLALFGAGLLWCFREQFWWLVGSFTGFLMVAPVVATGLYSVSRAAAKGQRLTLHQVLAVWRTGDSRMVHFGLLLGLAGTGWVLVSAGLITLWAEPPVHKPLDFIRHVVLEKSPGLFEVWLLLGAWLAAPVFASSVLTLPLLMDSQLPLWTAVGESWRAVGAHPLVLGVWAVLIVILVSVGMLTAMLGLIVVVPWLAHASWHAYQDLYRASPAWVAPTS